MANIFLASINVNRFNLLFICSVPLKQVQQYRERCGVLQARVKALECASLSGGDQLRELEEKLVAMARERQEEAELHHEELRASMEKTEEQQQRCVWGGVERRGGGEGSREGGGRDRDK